MQNLRIVIGFIFLITSTTHSVAEQNFPEKGRLSHFPSSPLFKTGNETGWHPDSIHQLNFRYADKKRGLRPWIAPTALIAGGTALYFMPAVKEGVRDFMQENLAYHGRVEDYLLFAPGAAVYALNLAGIPGKNNFGNRSALIIKSILLNSLLTFRMKTWINAPRPNQEGHSFPSGHTSSAFTFAHFMHKEYGEQSPWYSIGAYSVAGAVGIMRMAKNVHWFPDVVMGAGIGILSTELVYLTHQYKWDSEHIKHFDIFPFQVGNQKGVTMVYRF